MYFCFYDLQKVFDSVQYPILLKRLDNFGINGRTWRLLKSWYNHPKCKVKVDDQISAEFTLERGVLQGSVQSPVLFLLVMDPLLRELEQSGLGSHQTTLIACLHQQWPITSPKRVCRIDALATGGHGTSQLPRKSMRPSRKPEGPSFRTEQWEHSKERWTPFLVEPSTRPALPHLAIWMCELDSDWFPIGSLGSFPGGNWEKNSEASRIPLHLGHQNRTQVAICHSQDPNPKTEPPFQGLLWRWIHWLSLLRISI